MKQNIFYKGRIYIGVESEYLHLADGLEFEQYLLNLISYPYTDANLKDGQVVVEGKDYILQAQKRQVVAIPKEQPHEGEEQVLFDNHFK